MMGQGRQKPVLVVGAGIGGLTAALALARRGVPVEVYEQRAGRTIELAGTGMTIWSNATTALGTLGIADEIIRAGEVITRVRNVNEKDELVFETDVDALRWEGSLPSVSIARGALVRVLLEACERHGVPVHFDAPFADVTDDRTGVTMRLADGTSVPGSALIGADGVRSAVRARLVGDGEPTYYGISVWRGLSAGSGGIEPGLVHMFQTGSRAGLAGMAWHVGEGRVAWTIGMKAPAGVKESPRTMHGSVMAAIRDVQGPPRRYVAETDPAGVIRVDLYARDRHCWGQGLITFVGDAGHAMPTVLGQGACQAIEDAVVLGDCFDDGAADRQTVLRAYERRREERVNLIRGQVYRIARMQQWSSPVLVLLRDFAARVIVPRIQPKMWRGLLQPPAVRSLGPAGMSSAGQ